MAVGESIRYSDGFRQDMCYNHRRMLNGRGVEIHVGLTPENEKQGQ
jgi:hypothetical protein